tara:strand:+ start:188 stop:403 length:216 start_codon:yes stop_codon:yes gene_type:complete
MGSEVGLIAGVARFYLSFAGVLNWLHQHFQVAGQIGSVERAATFLASSFLPRSSKSFPVSLQVHFASCFGL